MRKRKLELKIYSSAYTYWTHKRRKVMKKIKERKSKKKRKKDKEIMRKKMP